MSSVQKVLSPHEVKGPQVIQHFKITHAREPLADAQVLKHLVVTGSSLVSPAFSKAMQLCQSFRMTERQVKDMYAQYQLRMQFQGASDDPVVTQHKVTGLARTMLLGKGVGFGIFDREDAGDEAINTGKYKGVFHAVGFHDGEHYSIGVCDIAKIADERGESVEEVRETLKREGLFAKKFTGRPRVIDIPLTFEQDGKYYFVMKFYPGGELYKLQSELIERTKTMPLGARVSLARKILEGVNEVQRQNVIHRDLKPENILLDEQVDPIVCDFGSATLADDESELGITKAVGTFSYMAPEIVHGKPAILKSDTWSAGVILYHLLALDTLPWEKVPENRILLKLRQLKRNWEPALAFTLEGQEAEIKQLLRDMLKTDPRDRCSIQQALDRIRIIEQNL